MADSFKFELVSPERLLVSQDVESVVVPGTEGEMTVMAHHAPTMTSLKAGVVTVNPVGGSAQSFVVFGGFADILPDGVTLLAESATPTSELSPADIARRIDAARAELEKAEDLHEQNRLEDYLHQLTTLEGAILPA